MPQETASTQITATQAMRRMLVSLFASLLLSAVLIFGAAGRLDWNLAWLFILAWTVPKLVFLFHLRLHNPELLIERATRHKNTQRYERFILPLYFLFAFGTFVVASLDGGRYRWSGDVSGIWVISAYAIYILGNSLAGWAINSNPFFSAESRLQTDRAQSVTKSGPYRFIRHPGYTAAVLLWLTTGLMLESWWAVIPGLIAALLMVLRTVFEDRMLIKELPGYVEYAKQVHYRLIPGIW